MNVLETELCSRGSGFWCWQPACTSRVAGRSAGSDPAVKAMKCLIRIFLSEGSWFLGRGD